MDLGAVSPTTPESWCRCPPASYSNQLQSWKSSDYPSRNFSLNQRRTVVTTNLTVYRIIQEGRTALMLHAKQKGLYHRDRKHQQWTTPFSENILDPVIINHMPLRSVDLPVHRWELVSPANRDILPTQQHARNKHPDYLPQPGSSLQLNLVHGTASRICSLEKVPQSIKIF